MRSLVAVCATEMYSPAKHVLIFPHTVFAPALLEIVHWLAKHDPRVAHLRSLDSVGAICSNWPAEHFCTSWHVSSWWLVCSMYVLPSLQNMHLLAAASSRCPGPHVGMSLQHLALLGEVSVLLFESNV